MLDGMVGGFEDVRINVGLREIGDRITARFEEQQDLLAIGGPGSAEAHTHPPAQRLDYSSLLDNGSGTRNRPIAPAESGP
jgi:hypothetical protein